MSTDELDSLSEQDGSVDRRFTQEMTRGLDRWLDMADGKLRGGDIPCILNIDGVLQGAVLDRNEKRGKVSRHILMNG